MKYCLRSKPKAASEDRFILDLILDPKLQEFTFIINNYENNGDGTVTDYATGLIWQQSGCINELFDDDDALLYIKKINREKFAGHNDWRLPTVDELCSLLEKKKQPKGLYIDDVFDQKQSEVWSSDKLWACSTSGLSYDSAYIVSFKDCSVDWPHLLPISYARGVRSLTKER